MAQSLEHAIEQDSILAEIAIPRLVTLWKRCGNLDKALWWQITALQQLNHVGVYQAALRYAEEIETQLAHVRTLFPDAYAFAATSVYFCYLSCGDVDRAYHVMMEYMIDSIDTHPALSQAHYLLAMLHARFFPQRDLVKAVEHLEQGLALLKNAVLPQEMYFFQYVFLNNGLAYMRAQQKMPEEAIHDLDAAIMLNPHDAVFYQNRAAALLDVHLLDEAIRDLQMYLQLHPDAEDRAEVEQQMLSLHVQS